ncbi:hypothetical protein NECAME_06442 [Necator americanus]|uniref:SNARE domain protein n=1 Tax=Necator americanus TaxID=51031 RepID=W2TUN8_NECAM|nr:hypothetical protein NECAME_06442 [Necator americanus]ETN85354.1 hypothetical protein NECAME_06442 [Necator americanus]
MRSLSKEVFKVVLCRRRDYLSFNSPVLVMSDDERDAFDKDTEKVLSRLEYAINRLSSEIVGAVAVADEKKHLSLVVGSLCKHLKYTAKTVAEMRELRLRNTNIQQNVQHLYSLVEAKQQRDQKRDKVLSNPNTSRFSPKQSITTKWSNNKDERSEQSNSYTKNTEPKSTNIPQNDWQNVVTDLETKSDDELSNLTPHDRTQLTAENTRIFERFSHVHAHIEGLETQITEIQRLHGAFAEKIMEQERDIEIINEAALSTSENLNDGNEWIRRAISNSAGRRVVVLFCITVITFTLLFLDWYNP